jgi:hypothetical protein
MLLNSQLIRKIYYKPQNIFSKKLRGHSLLFLAIIGLDRTLALKKMKIAQKSWPQRDMGTSKFSAELLSA